MNRIVAFSCVVVGLFFLYAGSGNSLEVTTQWLKAKKGDWREYRYSPNSKVVETVTSVQGRDGAMRIVYVSDEYYGGEHVDNRKFVLTGEQIIRDGVDAGIKPVRSESVTIENGMTLQCEVYSLSVNNTVEETYICREATNSGVVLLKNALTGEEYIKMTDFGHKNP